MADLPVCGNVKEACACVEPIEHEGNHVCRCAGSWTPDGMPVTFPGGGSFWDLFDPDYMARIAGAFPDPKPAGVPPQQSDEM